MRKKKIVLIIACLCLAIILTLSLGYNLAKRRQVIRTQQAKSQNKAGLDDLKVGKYDDAIKSFDIVLEKYDGVTEERARALFLKGIAYRLNGSYELALTTFREISARYPNIAPLGRFDLGTVELEIGITLQEFGRQEEAIRTWKKVIEKYPDSYSALFAKFLLGELSVEEFQNQISQMGFSGKYIAYIEYLIGLKFQMDGNLEEAKRYYKRCIELSEGEGISYQQAKKALQQIK
jgi:tetratricopeptide (TPR) repeat protein